MTYYGSFKISLIFINIHRVGPYPQGSTSNSYFVVVVWWQLLLSSLSLGFYVSLDCSKVRKARLCMFPKSLVWEIM